MKIFILAGGSGKRLWPLIDPPKQFRCFGGLHSLLQQTVIRLMKQYRPSDLYVITGKRWEATARLQCDAISKTLADQLIVEPKPSNTAPAIAYALNALGDEIGQSFLVVPSDHFLYPEERFFSALDRGEAHMETEEGRHLLFGITPTSPSENYGYIGCEAAGRNPSPVTAFHEKPDQPLAQALIERGFLWNSGMILFHTETFKRQLPKVVPPISIDYLLLEKAPNLRVIHLDITWSDLGSWEGIYAAYDKDEMGNVIFGNVKVEGVRNCLVIGDEEPATTVCSSCKNRVVILSEGAENTTMPLGTQIPSPL